MHVSVSITYIVKMSCVSHSNSVYSVRLLFLYGPAQDSPAERSEGASYTREMPVVLAAGKEATGKTYSTLHCTAHERHSMRIHLSTQETHHCGTGSEAQWGKKRVVGKETSRRPNHVRHYFCLSSP